MTQALANNFLEHCLALKEQYLLASDFTSDCSTLNELVMTAGTPCAILSETHLPNVGFFSTVSVSRCLLAETDKEVAK